MLGGYFILPHPVQIDYFTLYILHYITLHVSNRRAVPELGPINPNGRADSRSIALPQSSFHVAHYFSILWLELASHYRVDMAVFYTQVRLECNAFATRTNYLRSRPVATAVDVDVDLSRVSMNSPVLLGLNREIEHFVDERERKKTALILSRPHSPHIRQRLTPSGPSATQPYGLSSASFLHSLSSSFLHARNSTPVNIHG